MTSSGDLARAQGSTAQTSENDPENDPENDKVKPKLTVNALAFGDLYGVLSHHTEANVGDIGAWLRRGYLTFDGVLTKRLTARLRFELNQCGEFECYDFDVDYKDVWLQLEVGEQKVTLGLQPTPTFDLIESFWGYRHLERTPLDVQRVASRETGISAKGRLSGAWSYRAMIGRGVDFGNETGDGPKTMLAANYDPPSPWLLDFYVSYEQLPGAADRTTLQAFAARETDTWRVAFQYSFQDREDDPGIDLASMFAVRELSERWSLIGRVDRLFEPSPAGESIAYLPFDPTARATLLIAGAEARITRSFSLLPNVEVIRYDRPDSGGPRPETDFLLRLTFYLHT